MGRRTGNKFGWHSGVLTCKDEKVLGDLYVQDDIIFSDVSAGTLGVTGGIDMTSTTSAIGINMTGGTFSDSAIKITGVNGQGIYINKTASNGPTVKAHCHQLAAVTTDAVANEFKGEFLSIVGTMDGIASHFHMNASGTGILRAVLGVAYLDSGKTLSGTDYTTGSWLTGGVFVANSSGVVNGTGVVIAGLYGGISSCVGSTLTACKYLTSIWADSSRLVSESAGDSSLILATNQTGAVQLDYGIQLVTADLITTGISISGTSTNAIQLSGAVTRGIDFASGIVGITTDRSKSAISIGKRGSSVFAVTCVNTQACHFDPIQINVDVVGANPNATSTMNMIYQQITHDTTNMSNLRLKGADWTIKAAKNLQDAYIFQGEIDFTANTTVGGEAAGLAISMTTAATSVVTGNVLGAILMTSFTSAVSVSASLFISHRVGTLTHGIYFEPLGSTTITDLLYLNNAGTVTNFFNATTESGGIGTTRATPNSTATCDGSLKVLIGAKTLYIPLYNTIALT